MELAKRNGFPLSIYTIKTLPKSIGSQQNIIYNLDDKIDQRGGTHWCCIWQGEKVIYVDPFGLDPPKNVEDFMKSSGKEVLSNTTQIQNIKSTHCGGICIWVLSKLNQGASIIDVVTSKKPGIFK